MSQAYGIGISDIHYINQKKKNHCSADRPLCVWVLISLTSLNLDCENTTCTDVIKSRYISVCYVEHDVKSYYEGNFYAHSVN